MNHESLYQELTRVFPEQELEKWFGSLSLAVSGTSLEVRFPHRFFAQWFATQVQSRFEQALAATDLTITYHVREDGQDILVRERTPSLSSLPFGREFVFENFLTNQKNYFPLASAQEVAQSADVVYNPFVLCGESGAGKSFLLRAIANAHSERHAEDVFVAGIEEMHGLYASRSDARTHVMGMDFFGLDDVQDIKNYPYLQTELIALFDYFYNKRKQMVFSCCGKIAHYDFLTPKLKSRLEWGLIVALKSPDLDIRTQYTQARCRERHLDLSRERILLLAQRFPDLRNLEGCLLKLWAYRELVQDQIPDDEFENILNYLDDRSTAILTSEHVLTVVCAEFSLSQDQMLSAVRKQELVYARQAAIYLCRTQLGLSFPEIGRILGGRDHSTILYHYKKVKQAQSDDKNLKTLLQSLSEKCLALAESSKTQQ